MARPFLPRDCRGARAQPVGGRDPDLPRAPHARPQPRSPGRRAARHACTVPRCRRAPLRAQVGARPGRQRQARRGPRRRGGARGLDPRPARAAGARAAELAPPAQVSGPVAAPVVGDRVIEPGTKEAATKAKKDRRPAAKQQRRGRENQERIAARRDRTGSSRGPGTGRDRPGVTGVVNETVQRVKETVDETVPQVLAACPRCGRGCRWRRRRRRRRRPSPLAPEEQGSLALFVPGRLRPSVDSRP